MGKSNMRKNNLIFLIPLLTCASFAAAHKTDVAQHDIGINGVKYIGTNNYNIEVRGWSGLTMSLLRYHSDGNLASSKQLCKPNPHQWWCTGTYELGPNDNVQQGDYLVVLDDGETSPHILIDKNTFPTAFTRHNIGINGVKYLDNNNYNIEVRGWSGLTMSLLRYHSDGNLASSKQLCTPNPHQWWCTGTYELGPNDDIQPGDYLLVLDDGETSPHIPVDVTQFPTALYNLPSKYNASKVVITVPTTMTGKMYPIYANGKHEAPLHLEVDSDTPIPSDVLAHSVEFYDEDTGKPFPGSGDTNISLVNNGFDAAIPSNNLGNSIDNKSRSYKNIVKSILSAYLTTTKPQKQIKVCAKVLGTTLDTCAPGIDAPALINSIPQPVINIPDATEHCVWHSGTGTNQSDFADYRDFSLTINGIIDPVSSAYISAYAYKHSSIMHSTTVRDDWQFSPSYDWKPFRGRQKPSEWNAHRHFEFGIVYFKSPDQAYNLKVTNAGDGDSYSYPELTGTNHIFLLTETNTDGGAFAWGNVDFENLSISITDVYGNMTAKTINGFHMSC